MKMDVIKTLKKRPASKRYKAPGARNAPKAKRPKAVTPVTTSPLDLENADWRVVLTITRANELSDAQRYSVVNWLRAKANDIGNDSFTHNVASTFRARSIV